MAHGGRIGCDRPLTPALSQRERETNGAVAESGFTLLELLVALVVFGFVLAGLVGGLQFGLRAQDTQARTISAQADLGGTDRLLRNLVAEMEPGSGSEPPDITGGPHALDFVTDLGRAAAGLGEGGSALVALGVDGQHRLVLRWEPVVHAVRLRPGPAPGMAVLLTGLDGVDFAYWAHGQGGGGSWQTTWADSGIPPLVRIRLRFPADSHRSWPDIIATTERLPTGG